MNYFGPEKFRKEWETLVPTPVGQSCILCKESVIEGDLGLISSSGQVTHYECGMRGVVGSVGHQQRKCSCFGGTEEDPPDMTYRQSAIAACRLWDESNSF
jgi:hypothetical protein